MKRKILVTVIGFFALASMAMAQARFDDALFAAARKALPAAVSTNDISRALVSGIWHSNKTAVAIGLTNSAVPLAFVFLKQPDGTYLSVDASIGLGLGIIGIAGASSYERLELTPSRWLYPENGTLQLMMRTRAWRSGQRYTVEKVVLITPDGKIGTN